MLLVFQGSRNERFKQRMRIGRTGFQFRMELDPNIPRMFAFRQFDNFRQFAVRQRPSLNQSMGEEFFLQGYFPRRMVPPLISTLICSGMR